MMRISEISGRHIFLVMIMLFVAGFAHHAQAQTKEAFPMWEEGYLDIHAINTGLGESTFFVMPDGTTMLVDAGHGLYGLPRSVPKPDDSRAPGEWIARYIAHMMQDFPEPRLNYLMVSHFHWDHMGAFNEEMPVSRTGAYLLSGVTEVADHIPFDMMIDRNWPDYNWPVVLDFNGRMDNYRAFLNWHMDNQQASVEQFRVGVNNQIVLVNEPDKHPEFEIRNIAANGHVWTGLGDATRNHFPELEYLDKSDYPSENNSSIVFRLSYGKFDYFTGGDISFRGAEHGDISDQWKDIETPVAKATGPVDVLKANHHANYDCNSAFFLNNLRPRVIVMHTWLAPQPAMSTWRRMITQEVYQGPRDVFATNIHEAKRIVMGSEFDKMASQQGHVVVRVLPGGDTYYVYVLDDSEESYLVKSVHGPYSSN